MSATDVKDSKSEKPTAIGRLPKDHKFPVPAGFRSAKSIDFQEGKIVFVRGKKAVCKGFEFPLVYWVSPDSEHTKHRSFVTDPDMFTILVDESATSAPTPSSSLSSASATPSTPVGDAPVSFSLGFEPKTQKIEKKQGTEIEVKDLKQGNLVVEDCENVTLVCSDSLSTLSLRNSSNVRLTLPSVSRTDLIGVQKCSITLRERGTYTLELDNSKETSISFPKDSDSVVVISSPSSATTTLIASGGGGEDIKHVVELPPASSEASSHSNSKSKTTYMQGAFKTIALTAVAGASS